MRLIILALLFALPSQAVAQSHGPVIEQPAASESDPFPYDWKPVSPSDRACISKWRAIHYGAHAADIATTLIGSSRNGEEGNPLLRGLLGKKPSALGLIGVKAAAIGITEWQVSRSLRAFDGKCACRAHKRGAFITAGFAALNLRYVF